MKTKSGRKPSGEELTFGSWVSPEALALERDGLRLTDHRFPLSLSHGGDRGQAPFTTDSLGSTQILFLEISVSQ